jgi:hypothetical protein
MPTHVRSSSRTCSFDVELGPSSALYEAAGERLRNAEEGVVGPRAAAAVARRTYAAMAVSL